MIITIKANLTEEQALLLAKEKGYNPTIVNNVYVPDTTDLFSSETITNPQTVGEFLSNVYQAMVKNDAESIYISVFNQNRDVENEAARQMIRDQVETSISSVVE